MTATSAARKARRGRGEGSIHFDQRAGLWVGVVDLGIVNGKRVRRTVRARRKPDMLEKLKALHAGPAPGLAERDDITTREWLDWWADNVLPGTVAASTEGQYRQVVKDWVAPYVGHVRLAELRAEHVIAMMRALESKGLSPRTQRLARTILRRSLTHAERYDRVSRNVAALTDPPKKAGSKLDDALDAGEAARVLDAAQGDRLEALAVLVLTVGVRQAEALDLRWTALDLDAGAMRVAGTKTAASVRTVALPPFVAAALRRHRVAQLEERLAAPVWADPDLVFTTSIGTRIDRRNVLRWWHQLTIRAGVGRRRFHASRHTAATLMLNNGVSLEVVSATLGHAGLAITADVYAKVRPELQRTAATAMENLLGAGAAR